MSGEHSVSAPLTVAHVIHSLGAGGAESVLVELARSASRADMRLVVIGLSDAVDDGKVDDRVVPQLQALGVTVHQLHSGRYDPTVALSVRRILRAERVDVVHTHLKHADVVGGLAARSTGLPSVSTLHVIDTPTSRAHGLRLAVAAVVRRLSDQVIALSSEQLRWYEGSTGNSDRITLLPNGVSEPRVGRAADAVRSELGVPESDLLAVCVSLMRPEKGHADLLAAIGTLPADLPLVVALAGDGPLLDDIRSRVDADPTLSGRTRVLGFRGDVADLLAAADFVVHPSLADALPTALISALAAGRPVVATEVGGIPDIVGPDCGILVRAGDPDALARGIADMVAAVRADPRPLQIAARARYDARFSAEVWAAGLRRVYQKVIAGSRGSESKRIALVEFPPSGGLFQFSFQLGEALAGAGHTVELLTGPNPELAPAAPGHRVRSVLPTWHPAAGGGAPDWWRRGRRVLRAGQHTAAWAVLIARLAITRPDVVMWSEWRFPTDGWGVHVVRKLLPGTVLGLVAHEPRVLVEQPGQDGMYKTSGLTDRALSRAFADLDVTYVLGESAKAAVLATWPITGAVHVIPHGDAGIFGEDSAPPAAEDGPVVLCFGTITTYKGVDILLDAWPRVRDQVPAARLVIAGAFSADVDESDLRARVAALPGVTLNDGYVPLADVPSYFATARCVVLPYKRASQSGVVHLAQTFGRAVVASRVGDIPEVVDDGRTGLLVCAGDAEDLASALVRLLEDPSLAAELGAAGATSLEQRSSWPRVAETLLAGLPSEPLRRGHQRP